MTEPTCPYCGRPLDDPRGCEYLDDDARPVTFGDESESFAGLFGLTPATLNAGPACSDCATPRGKAHHTECLRSECPKCHHQFGLCAGVDCEAVWQWATGGTPNAA